MFVLATAMSLAGCEAILERVGVTTVQLGREGGGIVTVTCRAASPPGELACLAQGEQAIAEAPVADVPLVAIEISFGPVAEVGSERCSAVSWRYVYQDRLHRPGDQVETQICGRDLPDAP
jgi:hypothetical protein